MTGMKKISPDAQRIGLSARRDLMHWMRGRRATEEESERFYRSQVYRNVLLAIDEESKPFIDFPVRLATYRLVPGLTDGDHEVQASVNTIRAKWFAVYEELCPSPDSATTPASAAPSLPQS